MARNEYKSCIGSKIRSYFLLGGRGLNLLNGASMKSLHLGVKHFLSFSYKMHLRISSAATDHGYPISLHFWRDVGHHRASLTSFRPFLMVRNRGQRAKVV
jgi:hypothetical protein